MEDIFENKDLPPKAFTHAMVTPQANKGKTVFSSPDERIANANILNRTQDMRGGGIFLNELVAADTNRSVFNQTHNPKVLTAAEAERWKEYNSYEPRHHNQKIREKLREQLNNASHELAVRRQAEIFARK